MKLIRIRLSVTLAAVALAVFAAAFQSGKKLFIDDKLAATDLRVIGGRTYAPIADIAKALGRVVRIRPDGYEFVKANAQPTSPTTETPSASGEASSGRWRLKVLSVSRLPGYDVKYSRYSLATHFQAGAGNELLILPCRVTNAGADRAEIVLGQWEGNNTGLLDAKGNVFQPTFYDVVETEGAPVGAAVDPGAGLDFTLVFEVPAGTTPKELVFTLIRYSKRSLADQQKEKPDEVRVGFQN